MSADIRNSVLAMYDIRGKQEFIFRTNKLKEIAGGSWIIRDCFNDYLFAEAKKIKSSERIKNSGKTDGSKGIFYYKDKNGKTIEGCGFTEKGYLKHLEDGYLGEVVYDGGGNFILLLESEETFKELTYRFTKRLMEEIGTLRVLGSCVPVIKSPDDQKDNPKNEQMPSGDQSGLTYNGILSDYQSDEKRLRAVHRRHEMEESIIAPWSCLPIVQVDRQTSQPLVYANEKSLPEECQKGKYSKECLAKMVKYSEVMKAAKRARIEEVRKARKGQEQQKDTTKKDGTESGQEVKAERYFIHNEKIFDNLVEEKGEDSLLAVVYIDGNRMGAKVQECLNAKNKDGSECKSYEDCVKRLREFSEEIQRIYVDSGIHAALKNEKGENDHRLVVYAGDEVNFVVNAHDAYDCAKRYLQALPEGNSACAGIAVFHSHAPYADAYSIAEECCETGKKRMKDLNQDDACYIDWHICQGGMGISLEQLRKDAGEARISRPWLLTPIGSGRERITKKDRNGKETDVTTTMEVEEMAAFFRTLGRNNVKDLAALSQKGSNDLSMDLMRIKAHSMSKLNLEKNNKEDTNSSENKRDHSQRTSEPAGQPTDLMPGKAGTSADSLNPQDLVRKRRLTPTEIESCWAKLGLAGKSGWQSVDEHERRLIYDTVLAYDLWFAEKEDKKENNQEEEHNKHNGGR